MRFFEREMRKWKKDWNDKMEKIKKERIRWRWETNWGNKYKGEYEGELKDGKP